jgi:hypothetical protein
MTTPTAPARRTLWANWRGGRVGVQFDIVAKESRWFLTRPVGVVAGPESTLFEFPEQCEIGWADLSNGFTDDAMDELMSIAGFSAHQLLQIARLAHQKA